jgi:hypothetical protein
LTLSCSRGHDSEMTVPNPPDESPPGDDTALLVAALNHAWSWYDARISRGLQVVNYFLVAVAILANAYVFAINGKQYVVAGLLGLSGAVAAALAFAVGYQQMRLANVGEVALAELQDRVAGRLGVDSVRMAEPLPVTALRYVPSWVAFGLAGLLGIGAALYALVQ